MDDTLIAAAAARSDRYVTRARLLRLAENCDALANTLEGSNVGDDVMRAAYRAAGDAVRGYAVRMEKFMPERAEETSG